jgi:hypothetical protein
MNRWKPALNAFAITFEGRIFPTENDDKNRASRDAGSHGGPAQCTLRQNKGCHRKAIHHPCVEASYRLTLGETWLTKHPIATSWTI